MYRLLAVSLLAGCAQDSSDRTDSAGSTGQMVSEGRSSLDHDAIEPAFLETVDAAKKADAVFVARLEAVNFSAPAGDNFLTTMRFRVTDVLRGSIQPDNIISIRYIPGQDADGNWRWTAETPFVSPSAESRMKTGDSFLIFTSAATYRAQAEARGGAPLDGATGAGLGLYRLRGAVIEQTGSYRLPADVAELKKVLKNQTER